MNLRMHDHYRRVIEKAHQSHQQNRNPSEIPAEDTPLARLYSYGYRLHVIGAFHATRVALAECPATTQLGQAHRGRAVETLEDLASQSMEPVPADFQAVITSLYRYHRGVLRVLESLQAELTTAASAALSTIRDRFRNIMEAISSECGIHLTQDTKAPEQAGFVVPGLGITIVPLVYGEHHSWNLAWLAGEERNVPTHRHEHGVEIHLGYEPTHGVTVLGNRRAEVDEGYAMPIPPQTDHGWVNTTDAIHHVPFIFGSLRHAGWGVFLDVEPSGQPVSALQPTPRDSPAFSQMVYLEREISRAAQLSACWRKTLIPYTVTHRGGSGGLELCLTRANRNGFTYPQEAFRALSISRGTAEIDIEGITRQATQHDHFGVPAGLQCKLRQVGDEPLVVLDALIRDHSTVAPERR